MKLLNKIKQMAKSKWGKRIGWMFVGAIIITMADDQPETRIVERVVEVEGDFDNASYIETIEELKAKIEYLTTDECPINTYVFSQLNPYMTLEEMVDIIGRRPDNIEVEVWTHSNGELEITKVNNWYANELGWISAWFTDSEGTTLSAQLTPYYELNTKRSSI